MRGGVLIDSNVLIDMSDPDAVQHRWSCDRIAEAISGGHARINPLIYAEVAGRYGTATDLEEMLDPTEIRREELPYAAAFPAMRAFLRYKEAGGPRLTCMPDFFIGAHAEADKLTLLTRDAARFRTYFPAVKLITPEG